MKKLIPPPVKPRFTLRKSLEAKGYPVSPPTPPTLDGRINNGGARTKQGRPRKYTEEDATINLRLTPQEYEIIDNFCLRSWKEGIKITRPDAIKQFIARAQAQEQAQESQENA